MTAAQINILLQILLIKKRKSEEWRFAHEVLCREATRYLLSISNINNLKIISSIDDFFAETAKHSLEKFLLYYKHQKSGNAGPCGYLKILLRTTLIDNLAKFIFTREKTELNERIWFEFFRLIENHSKNKIKAAIISFLQNREIGFISSQIERYFQSIICDAILSFDKSKKKWDVLNESFWRYFKGILRKTVYKVLVNELTMERIPIRNEDLKKILMESGLLDYPEDKYPDDESMDVDQEMAGRTIIDVYEQNFENDNTDMVSAKENHIGKMIGREIILLNHNRVYPHRIFTYIFCKYLYYLIEDDKGNAKDIPYSTFISYAGNKTIKTIFYEFQELLNRFNDYPSAQVLEETEIKMKMKIENFLQDQVTYQKLRKEKGKNKYGNLQIKEFYYKSENKNMEIRKWCIDADKKLAN